MLGSGRRSDRVEYKTDRVEYFSYATGLCEDFFDDVCDKLLETRLG